MASEGLLVKTAPDDVNGEKFLLEQKLVIIENAEVDEEKDRGVWSRKLDYMLSLIGYCVGLGNLWRFPYLCNRNGGGAFLIPFLFFLVTCGLPLFFLEVSVGQFSAKSSLHVWSVSPLFKGLGYGMIIISGITTLYYNIIIAWSIYYIIRSCASVLPWTTCGNWWNSPFCIGDNGEGDSGALNETLLNQTSDLNSTYTLLNVGLTTPEMNETDRRKFSLAHSAVEEFWQYNTLRISGRLEIIGGIQWHLALCFLGAWFIVFFCLIKGVRSVGKVVYVTATMPYVLLAVLLIRGLTLPGAIDGLVFYLKPDFSRLLEIQVWLEACLQVFYSLGPAWGGLITMSSYNKFKNNCLRDAVLVTFISEGTSIFAGLVIFTILGFMAHQAGVPVSEVVTSEAYR